MKIAWVTDSGCAIHPKFAEEHNVNVVPLQVIFDGHSYDDMVDITEKDFFQRIGEGEIPSSSQPSFGAFVTLYQTLQSEGYDLVISVHMSGSLSGTVNTARLAAQEVDIPVEIIDSGLVAKAMLFVLEEGLRIYEAKPEIGLDEIVEKMRTVRNNVVGYFIVNDLGYLHRGGRLRASMALVGSILQIKPILKFENQYFDVVGKVRTARKAKEFLYKLLDIDTAQGEIHEINVVHADNFHEAQSWMNQLKERFSKIPVSISTLGTAVAVHSGPKAIGLTWCKSSPAY